MGGCAMSRTGKQLISAPDPRSSSPRLPFRGPGTPYEAVAEANLNGPERTLNTGRNRGMPQRRVWRVLLAAAVATSVAGCAKTTTAAKSKDDPSGVVIHTDEKTGLSTIDFTKAPKSVERLGIKTVKVEALAGQPGSRTVPQGAVLYTAKGETLVYTNSTPLMYEHVPITIDHIQEDTAVLAEGPPPGTAVVTLGAAELTGIEFGVGK